MVLNGNMQSGATSAEEKMLEKKMMRAISRRRQKARELIRFPLYRVSQQVSDLGWVD